MNRNHLTLATLFTAAILLAAPNVEARGSWQAKTPRTQTAQKSLKRSTSSYGRAKASWTKHKGMVRRQMKRFRKTGNVKQKQWAQKNALKAGRSRVSMYKAQARGLQAKAKIAIKAGMLDKANQYQDQAAKLSSKANKLSSKLDNFQAKISGKAVASSKGATHKASTSSSSSAGSVSNPDNLPVPVSNSSKTTAAKGDKTAVKVNTRKLKRQAKLQLKSGDFAGAVDSYQKLDSAPRRRGLGGLVDGYRRWSTRRAINKKAYKAGKTAARIGDMEMATDSVNALRAMDKKGGDKPSWNTRRKINNISNQARKGAKKAAKSHRPELASEMLAFSKAVRASVGYKKPTLRYRWTRRVAKNRLMKDLKMRAKQGNMEAFRSAMRLASAYAREDGRALKKGQVKQIRKLYMTAMKNSVPRALADAQLLLSGRMGGVNVEEAANRYLYAMDTAGRLAKRGVKVKTGLFSKSIDKKFAQTRKMLVTSIQNQDSFEGKRPGPLKRLWEKITKQPYNRTQPQIAPMDSAWMQRMQRRAEVEQMANMAGPAPQQ